MSTARPQEIEMIVCLHRTSGGSGMEPLPIPRTPWEIVVFGFTARHANQPFAGMVSVLSTYMTQWRSLLLLAVTSPNVSCVARICSRRHDNTDLRDGSTSGFFSAAKPNLRNAP